MTNKPMLSVELRSFLEGVVKLCAVHGPTYNELRALLDNQADCRCKRYGKDNPHWPCPVHADPAAQHQGEPVAICRLWNEGGSGERTSVEFINGPCADGTLLYAEQPEPVAVVHTMKSIMEAVEASKVYTVLTSDQCHALAQALNGVKP